MLNEQKSFQQIRLWRMQVNFTEPLYCKTLLQIAPATEES